MYPFRLKVPRHQKNRRVCKRYKSYLKTLRANFNQKCGYCDDIDTNRIRNYTIDHFVPQNPDGWSHKILPNYYYNLIYSCLFCNSAKDNKWPTRKSSKHHNGIHGFIIPTKRTYGKLFFRDMNGAINYNAGNPLAKYIYDELNLWHPIHSLNWRFQKILSQEKDLEYLIKTNSSVALIDALKDLKVLRVGLVDEINEKYNS